MFYGTTHVASEQNEKEAQSPGGISERLKKKRHSQLQYGTVQSARKADKRMADGGISTKAEFAGDEGINIRVRRDRRIVAGVRVWPPRPTFKSCARKCQNIKSCPFPSLTFYEQTEAATSTPLRVVIAVV